MATQDQTLQQFIEQYSIGELQPGISQKNLMDYGHTEESAGGTEILMYLLDFRKNFEIGELPAIAASYLLRCGFDEVSTKGQRFSGKTPKGHEEAMAFTQGSLITGIHNEHGTTLIHVVYNETHCLFSKHPA